VKAVILAAGYATRLYPLTLDRPKHLLEVAGRPLLERLLEQLPLGELETVYVVTNAKFALQFREWARALTLGATVEVVDDGTTSDAERLGAIGDLELVIRTKGLDEDLVVAAGDGVFSERLDEFVRFGQERGAAAIAAYDVGELEAVKRLSSIVVDADWRVVSCEEKPDQPVSTLAGIALYHYPAPVLPLVSEYLEQGNNPDQPGRLVEWLYTRTPVYAWPAPGEWLDIGTPDALADAERMFGSPAS
jgi:glucose-1-phosphate thymidylyltransferase